MPFHLSEILRARDDYGRPFQRSAQAHRIKPVLRVALFGGMALYIGEREVALNCRKARAMLAYLALAPAKRETRDRLVGLLWSETEEAKARASLRQALYGLHKAFDGEGLPGLSADNSLIRLDQSTFATDLDHLTASIERGDPVDALVSEPRTTDALLHGYEDVDPSFGDWLTRKRESVRQHLIQALEVQLCRTQHSVEGVKRVARALFQLEPTHEIACRHLMCACVASGDTGGALAAYKQLWDCLEQEYDLEPSKTTQELVVAIRSGTHHEDRCSGHRRIDPANLVAIA